MISKQAVLDLIKEAMEMPFGIIYLTDKVNSLPSISDEWISCEDRLPEHGERVILRHDYGDRKDYSADLWSDESEKYYSLNCVTHWMPFTGYTN